MKRSRLLLTLLLSLLIPLGGFASLETDMGECPMEGMSPGEAMSLMQSMADMERHDHSCCQDEETFLRTGQLCKPGQECGAGFSLPSTAASVPAPPSPGRLPLPEPPALPLGPPDDLMRPPAP